MPNRSQYAKQEQMMDLADLSWVVSVAQSPSLDRLGLYIFQFAGKCLRNPQNQKVSPSLARTLVDVAKCALISHQPLTFVTKASQRLEWFPSKSTQLIVTRSRDDFIVAKILASNIWDAFIFRLIDLIQKYSDRIRVCRQCGMTFVVLRHRRQEYCGPSCSQKFRTAKMYGKRQDGGVVIGAQWK